MKCPKCESDKHSVVDSRSDGSSIRRRRECQSCQTRFSTFERIEYALPLVIKKSGQREEFSSEKVKAGIVRACEKRPVTLKDIDAMIQQIESKLQAMCLKEISTQRIGELMLESLKSLDKIAYIRFASVYREFSNVEEFELLLRSLNDESEAKDSKGENQVNNSTAKSIRLL